MDALFRAVDDALADILEGHPRLVAYDVHAVAQGPDAEGRVTVAILPPEGSGGARPGGPYSGDVQGTNIIAASIEAREVERMYSPRASRSRSPVTESRRCWLSAMRQSPHPSQ